MLAPESLDSWGCLWPSEPTSIGEYQQFGGFQVVTKTSGLVVLHESIHFFYGLSLFLAQATYCRDCGQRSPQFPSNVCMQKNLHSQCATSVATTYVYGTAGVWAIQRLRQASSGHNQSSFSCLETAVLEESGREAVFACRACKEDHSNVWTGVELKGELGHNRIADKGGVEEVRAMRH